MATYDQYIQLSSLPEDVRRQVLELIDRLMRGRSKAEHESGPDRVRPISGLLKGKIQIADDFDAPLDDFKDYME
ncbi:MAG TPA: DUF2281 domain-containing protein [Flavobacteriales bacterium]|nr:DUF2281 domain-containing protein [Flavobacteriales bacterium]